MCLCYPYDAHARNQPHPFCMAFHVLNACACKLGAYKTVADKNA